MADASTDTVTIDGYHGHVYYTAETRPVAETLRETIATTFGLKVRALSDEPVGPHLVPQFRFSFGPAQFETIVPWLMLNRQGLDVLVHPLTDSSLRRSQSLCGVAWGTGGAEVGSLAGLSGGAVSAAVNFGRAADA